MPRQISRRWQGELGLTLLNSRTEAAKHRAVAATLQRQSSCFSASYACLSDVSLASRAATSAGSIDCATAACDRTESPQALCEAEGAHFSSTDSV